MGLIMDFSKKFASVEICSSPQRICFHLDTDDSNKVVPCLLLVNDIGESDHDHITFSSSTLLNFGKMLRGDKLSWIDFAWQRIMFDGRNILLEEAVSSGIFQNGKISKFRLSDEQINSSIMWIDWFLAQSDKELKDRWDADLSAINKS